MDTIVICAVLQDAASGILEWLAFHRLIGVDRFVLYDLGSTDGTVGTIARSRFGHQVTVVDWGRNDARAAPADFVAHHASRFTWTILIEQYDFVYPLETDTIRSLLPRYDGCSAVLLRRLNFDPQTRPGQFVIGNHNSRMPDSPLNDAVPTLLRNAEFREIGGTSPTFVLDGVICNARGERISAEAPATHACDDVMVVNRYPTGPATVGRGSLATGIMASNSFAAAPLSSVIPDRPSQTAVVPGAVTDRRIMRFIPRLRAMLHDASLAAQPRFAPMAPAATSVTAAPVTATPVIAALVATTPVTATHVTAAPVATAVVATAPVATAPVTAAPGIVTPATAIAATATPAATPLLLGIGIITYNRQAILAETLDRVLLHTKHPHTIIAVADDGSTDGTLDLLRARQVLTVTGRNMSVAWNKNRALFLLSELLRCDVVVLLEDDAYPAQDQWELEWMRAAVRLGHANVAGQWLREHFVSGTGTAEDPIVSRRVTAQCAVFSREALLFGGYFDSRFHGYGHEHVEHTRRLIRMGYGGVDQSDTLFHLLSGGLGYHNTQSSFDGKTEQAEMNRQMADILFGDFGYRAPWRNEAEAKQFRDEMRGTFPRAVL